MFVMETEIFRALSDPTRRGVFECLADGGETTVSQLTEKFDVSQPAISQHLGVLRSAGLVRERRAGRKAYYRVAPDGLVPLFDWAQKYRAFWPSRIEKLKSLLREIEE